jgi:hypothetical protein
VVAVVLVELKLKTGGRNVIHQRKRAENQTAIVKVKLYATSLMSANTTALTTAMADYKKGYVKQAAATVLTVLAGLIQERALNGKNAKQAHQDFIAMASV